MTNINTISQHEMLDRYERAEYFLQGIFTSKLVSNSTVYPHWIEDSDLFWYVRDTKNGGKEYRLVDASSAANNPAFDHKGFAEKLGQVVGEKVPADELPMGDLEFSLNPLRMQFVAFDRRWAFDIESNKLKELRKALPSNWGISPDGSKAVFERNHNLWLRDLKTGAERALTHDGAEHYVYGAASSGWGSGYLDQVQARWSPDSERVFVAQRDVRKVKELPIVHHVPADGSLRPKLMNVKIPFQGDEHIMTLRLVAIEVETGAVQPADYRQVPITRNGWGFFHEGFGWWGKDSKLAYFIDMDRYYQYARLVEFNTDTGATRVVLEEQAKEDSFLTLMLHQDDKPEIIPLLDTDEILWFSERTGWAHLYLYDIKTGKLKNAVTSGDWLVRQVVRLNEKRREVFIHTAGRDKERDPYMRDLVRVNIDTGELVPLMSGDEDCFASSPNSTQVTIAEFEGKTFARTKAITPLNGVSPSGNYAVVTKGRVDTLPMSLLLDRDGKQILELEKADVSNLPEGWRWPMPEKMTAADGKTDIYGVLVTPTDFTPEKKWPVIDLTFGAPDSSFLPHGAFGHDTRLGWFYYEASALAELGFVVVILEGRGTIYREKAFQDEAYGWFESGDNIDDHVAGIKQLGERYPWMDMDRVGITTHPTGGHNAVRGMLNHPDFYKVGVSGISYNPRLAAALWVDSFEGPDGPKPGNKYSEELAENLEGKLMLMHGMLDAMPAANTFRLLDAFIKANKNVDLMLYPNRGHDLIDKDYIVRTAWDYLVRHLQGNEPPKGFRIKGTVYNNNDMATYTAEGFANEES